MTRSYDAYLSSARWRQTRKRKLQSRGGICERCGTSSPPMHVHHVTYERLGRERLRDLEVLCRSCHAKEHPEKLGGGVFYFSIESDCEFCSSTTAVANLMPRGCIAIQCTGCNDMRIRERSPGTELGQSRDQFVGRDQAVACVECRKGFQNVYAISQHHQDKHGVPWKDGPWSRKGTTP